MLTVHKFCSLLWVLSYTLQFSQHLFSVGPRLLAGLRRTPGSQPRFCLHQTIEYGELLSFCNPRQTNCPHFSQKSIEIVCLNQFKLHLFLSTSDFLNKRHNLTKISTKKSNFCEAKCNKFS